MLRLIIIALASLAYTQNRTAEIIGKVQDPAGAAIAGANITVRNVETGATRSGKASDAGDYTLPLLDPGNYEIRVEQAGFRTLQWSGIGLHVGDSVRID